MVGMDAESSDWVTIDSYENLPGCPTPAAAICA